MQQPMAHAGQHSHDGWRFTAVGESDCPQGAAAVRARRGRRPSGRKSLAARHTRSYGTFNDALIGAFNCNYFAADELDGVFDGEGWGRYPKAPLWIALCVERRLLLADTDCLRILALSTRVNVVAACDKPRTTFACGKVG